MSALLTPEFLRRLEAFRRQLSASVRSGAAGEGVAPRRGGSAEFREHRPYAFGDDPRRIDWNASARLGTPMLKLFQAEEDRAVRLLIDGSASLGFGTPSKLHTARQLAAALAYLALANSERAQVLLARHSQGNNALEAMGAARRGRAAFGTICRELEAIEAAGNTDLARSIDTMLARVALPGIVAIFSDFFDPGPVLPALSRARAAGHELVLVQVLDQEELTPSLEGDVELEDAETGACLSLSADATALEAYAERLAQLVQSLRSFAKRQGCTYILTTSQADLEPTLRRLLNRAID